MNPVILYDSRFVDNVPTATDTASGYDPMNIRDLRTYTSWKAASAGTKYLTVDCETDKAADAIGIFRHNLGTAQATVSVESSANGTDWTERLAGFAPSNDRAILKLFTTATARYWRVKIVTASVAARVAVLLLGNRLLFPSPPDGPFVPVEESVEAESTRSKTGQHLGAVIRFKPYKINPKWSNNVITRTFLDASIVPWWDSHASNLLPFFWAWDLTTYATDVRFVKVPDGYVYRPAYSVLTYADEFSIEMEGVKE